MKCCLMFLRGPLDRESRGEERRGEERRGEERRGEERRKEEIKKLKLENIWDERREKDSKK